MPEFSKLSTYIDQSGLEKDTEFFIKQLARVEREALSTAQNVKDAMSNISGAGGSVKGPVINTKQTLDGLKDLSLTTANYTKILAAVATEVDNLSESQKNQLKIINDNYKAEEIARQGAKETVKLIQTEIAQSAKKEASLSDLARAIALNKAEQMALNREIKLAANVSESERNSLGRAKALILQYTDAKNNLNLSTEQGTRLNESYNKAIQRASAFIQANADAETKRTRNIGNYNQAAQLVVDALAKEQTRLQSLTSSYKSFSAEVDKSRNIIQGFGAAAGGAQTVKFEQNIANATAEMVKLDAEIKQSRTIIEGFSKVQDTLPIGKDSENAAKQVQILTASLDVLEKEGLGTSQAAEQLREKIAGLSGEMYKAGTASKALDLIDKEIKKLNFDLSNTDKNSKQFGVLSAQINLLKSVSGGLNKTFTSTKAEMRALEESAKRLGNEFGVDSAQFQKFSKIVGANKNEIKDVQAALKFQSSDTRGLDATLQGVQAITSAYGAYQGIVALTGEENEELQKSMQKLQAVTALVVSIQGIVNALQSESALIQGLLAIKAKALAIAEGLVVAATKTKTAALAETIIASQASNVATGEKVIVENAALISTKAAAGANLQSAIAMKSGAASSLTLSTGLTGVTAAQTGVAASSRLMASALAATGIGLIVIALAAAVYKVVTAIQDWNAASASTKKANEDLVTSLKTLTEATKVYDDLNRQSSLRQLADLDKIIEKRKALGVNALTSLALDKKAAEERLKITSEEVKYNDISIETLKKKEVATLISAANVKAAEELKVKYIKETQAAEDKDYDKKIERFDDNIKKQTQAKDADLAAYQKDLEIFNFNEEAKQKSELITNQISKQTADDRRKIILESARIEVEIATSKNNEILSSDRSTLDERTKALKDNLEEQRKLLRAENTAVQNDPTVSDADKIISAKKTAAAIALATSEEVKAVEKLKEDFRIRDLAAETEANKKVLDIIVQGNEAILANVGLTEIRRLEALKQSAAARQAIAEADFNAQLSTAGISDENIKRIKEEGYFEIDNKKITNSELKKLIEDYNSVEISLASDTRTKLLSITKDYYEKEKDIRDKAMRGIERANQLEVEDRTDTYNNQIISLNESLRNKSITIDQYNKQRLKLDTDFSRDSLNIELKKVEDSLAATVTAKETEISLQKELNALKNFTGPETADKTAERGNLITKLEGELTAIQDTVGKETELYKQLSALKRQLSDGDANNFTKNQAKIVESLGKIQEVANEVFSGISGVLDGIGQRQKDNIDGQIQAIEQRRDAELLANEQSQEDTEKKAENKLRIEARAEQQKKQAEERKKQIDRQNAIREKAITIFQILLATALGIAKATTPYGKILAAISGAAQLAIAIATPLPKFKHGLNKDYSGLAIVGDGGKREAIIRKGGRVEITPSTDTLTSIEAGDRIHPDADQYLRTLEKISMQEVIRKTDNHVVSQSNYGAIMASALERNAHQIVSAITNKKEISIGSNDRGMVAIHKWGARQVKYINEQTNWD